MDRLPGLFPGHSPNLLGTPAAALPGNDGGGPAGAAESPATVKGILHAALQLRDRRDQGEIRVRRDWRLRADSWKRAWIGSCNDTIAHPPISVWPTISSGSGTRCSPCLYCPELEATNYRAEQAIRPMVVTRKVWGGIRTPRGAHTQSVLVSILHTCRQQLRPAISVVAWLLRSPKPEVLDLSAPDGFPKVCTAPESFPRG